MVVICNTPYPEDQDAKYAPYFAKFPYPLSDFQKYSIQAIVDGNHTLVTAATGNGKTVSAEFAIQHFTSLGKKVIYTSPIKALSNQKFFDFSKKYPEISFGIFTGDIKYNPNASVIFATAEILMNHLFSLKETEGVDGPENRTSLNFHIDIETELACVVMDECHYILDQDRGHVWENTILMLPKHVQMVLLSATLDQPQKFATFCEGGGEATDRKQVVWSSTLKRIVPLNHYGFLTTTESIFKKVKDKETQAKIRNTTGNFIRLKAEGGAMDEAGYTQLKWAQKLLNDNEVYLKRAHVLNTLLRQLVEKEMLPALVFTFSRKNVETCAKEITTNLLEFDSKVPYTIRRDAEQLLRSKISNFEEYLNMPEYQQLMSLLEKGIGIHHSGMIPILREIVEFMISKRQIKVLFATDSFSIGLNCEIKTVVFTSLQKFDGEHQCYLEPHQYTQMAGRAGRRNIDTVGHVIHCNNLFPLPSPTEYKQILCGLPQKMESKFVISYGMLLNLVRNGKNTRQDFIDFATKSMLTYNLQSQADAIQTKYQENTKVLETAEKSLKYLRTPLEILEEYNTQKETVKHLVNKKRKEMERSIEAKRDQYRTIDQDLTKYKEYRAWKQDQECLNKEIKDLGEYIPYQIDKIIDILIQNKFIDHDYENRDTYRFTEMGHFASHIAEIHCLAFTGTIYCLNFLKDFDSRQIVTFLSCMADIRVKDDVKLNTIPDDLPLKVQGAIHMLSRHLAIYEMEESDAEIKTGFPYKRAVQYDLLEPITKWLDVADEASSKLFLKDLWENLEISSGDFIKAVLKISTIAKECMSICEYDGHIELMGKLQEIDGLILKHICTTQSLYV